MNRIIVGVDGSPESRKAASFAADLAVATNARLMVAHAKAPIWPASPDVEPEWTQLQAEAEERRSRELLADTTKECARPGLQIEVQSLNGPAAPALADLADASDSDLLVVGHRGRNAIARVLLGSVADRLTQLSRRPVLVHR